MEPKFVVSLDVGGTKQLAAVVNSESGVRVRLKKQTTAGHSHEAFSRALVELTNEVISLAEIKPEQVAAVAVGIPGSVNMETGVIGLAPNLGLKNYRVREHLKDLLPYPVLVENDVNLAAAGELAFGAAISKKNALVVFVGTGIGSGLIIDGKIYRGSGWVAGEIGHIKVAEKGPKCGCGQVGCFEAVASRTAIVRDISELVKSGKPSTLKSKIEKNKEIKSKVLMKALNSGDKVTIGVFESACKTIGRVLAGVNNLMNFETIILGGGVMEANETFMLPRIVSAFKKYSLDDAAKSVEVVGTDLRDDAAIYGGIALTEEFLGVKV
ncbi:MAG: ROK family protein [Ignavibacteriales bacterium]|nr:Glucokinase [Ignavibacteriaceae bacterium]MBW7873819.1 ROK family protein [Ignavibacteria bacterium]MCZ2144156.1 ROK family protein [Ignavibacteriales bacterium]WKZ72640.1 MAG: ROK family protein [Ignavibacteriaceae bacterium]